MRNICLWERPGRVDVLGWEAIVSPEGREKTRCVAENLQAKYATAGKKAINKPDLPFWASLIQLAGSDDDIDLKTAIYPKYRPGKAYCGFFLFRGEGGLLCVCWR
jgi:hypothetical protein